MSDMQAAAQRKATKMKFKGKYAGPDKFKGVIPEGYKGKAKGKYFGKDSRQGANIERTKPSGPPPKNLVSPGKIIDDPQYKLERPDNDSSGLVSVGKRPMPTKKLKDPNRVKKYHQWKNPNTPAPAPNTDLVDAVKSQAG